MRYIRTKDGKIIKILKEGIDEFGKYGMIDEENCIRNYDNLKQANTIPELCDEFVWGNCLILFTNKEYTKFVIKQSPYIQDEEYDLNEDVDKEDTIYGAIWIIGEHKEPILKSVTKMTGILSNGEVDWELL